MLHTGGGDVAAGAVGVEAVPPLFPLQSKYSQTTRYMLLHGNLGVAATGVRSSEENEPGSYRLRTTIGR